LVELDAKWKSTRPNEETILTTVIYYDGTPLGWVCALKVNGTPKGPVIGEIPRILQSSNLPEGLVTSRSNQRAEYVALIFALSFVDNYSTHRLIGDNENVTKQMRGENKIKSGPMVTLNSKIREIINTRGLDIEFKHVHRGFNQAGTALDKYMRRR